jgi:hypothetical protein
VRKLFGGGHAVPSEVVARAGLGRGDRVLAHAATTDGSWLLGTRDALVVVEPAETIRVPWERVETADWDREEDRLRVAEVGEFGAVRPVHTFTVTEPGQLLAMLRERVTASVLMQRRVVVSAPRRRDHLGVRVRPRRRPGGSGGPRGGRAGGPRGPGRARTGSAAWLGSRRRPC